MDKRLKVELTELTDDGWKYRPLDGTEADGIMAGIIQDTNGKLQDTNGKPETDSDAPVLARLWIVVHSMEEFLCGDETMVGMAPPLAQDLLMSSGDPLPIIHITTTDIFLPSMYTSEPLHRLVPRYYLIIDNSIWNYHVSIFNESILRVENKDIERTPVELDFKKSFLDALDSIKKNYDRHLYKLQVAREYADLNARLSAQSYLAGAHAKGVSPFVFHSEAVVKQMRKDEFEDESNIKNMIVDRKWRLLLVDDKAVDGMGDDGKGQNAEKEGLCWNCKLNIILQTLRHYFKWENGEEMNYIDYRPCEEEEDSKTCEEDEDGKTCEEDEDGKTCEEDEDSKKSKKHNLDKCKILIEYAQTLDVAEKAMKNRTYDIVLLDYLLDIDEKRIQNYGFSLLNDVYNDRDKNGKFKTFNPKPSDRFFFMFISAYTTAVYERLRAETLNLSEDYWHISLGACPTNTPQLFIYNLLKLMEKRLNDSGLFNLSPERICRLMRDIYKHDEGSDTVRRRANKLYEKVLSLHYHYRKIMKDVAIPTSDSVFDTKGSVLMTDFATKNQNLGGLLEHMANLVHITAFGTIRQWPEMWEEYLYFKALYKQMLDDEDEKNAEKLFSDIEDYILNLKQIQG